MITVQLSQAEYDYLCRAVQRDIDDGESALLCGDDTDTMVEHAHACRMQRLLKKVEQTQLTPF